MRLCPEFLIIVFSCYVASTYRYTMETCGICAYITQEFAVFLEAKPSEKTGKRVGYQSAYTSRFHGVTGLYYTTHAL